MSCRLSDQHKRQFLFFSKVVLLIVISALYGNAAVAQVELVCKVQAILQELYDIGQAFPRSLSLDFSQPLQTVTRTGASLYLMLFQVIRPSIFAIYYRFTDNLVGHHTMHTAYVAPKSTVRSPAPR